MSEQQELLKTLSDRFGQKISEAYLSFGEPVVKVGRDSLRDLISFLKNDPGLSFDMLVDLFGVDYPEAEPRFEIVYILRSTRNNKRVTIKTRTRQTGMDTVSDLFKAAEWLEREIYDMFGVQFVNHPDLRRIYTDDDFEGHPLRKDFPLQGRDYDKPFTVTLEEERSK
ncbi:MAG TPA: NADH-quinone oxidoreductase subunit C [Syntrophorhabdaceae bacterium]|nr:NADH-quinone oxidoreductase subunit C [Syntrophorhabdaceae bacterium]